MSACPGCGKDARHIGATFSFDKRLQATVEHRCENPDCDWDIFDEKAKTVFGVLGMVERKAKTFCTGPEHPQEVCPFHGPSATPEVRG